MIRRKDGHNFTSLAKATGYSRQYISQLEHGARKPTPQVIAKLAEALNIPKSVIEPRQQVGDAA